MAKVSIIVPVYNVEKYIKECIESIINQTFKDIEIILVDDCSTDNSLSICKEFAKKDNRIILKCNKKLGVSEARNTGIRESSGEYIIFVDSDDWLEPNMVEKMYEIAEKSDSEIVLCSTYVNTKNSEYINDFYYEDYVFKGEEKVILQKQATRTYKKNEYVPKFISCAVPWAKIYKSSFIKENNILFDKKLSRAEDMIFNLYAFEYANSIKYISIPLYHYRRNNCSASSIYDETLLEKRKKMLKAFKNFADNTSSSREILKDAYNKKVFDALNEYISHLCRKKRPRFTVKQIEDKISTYLEKYLENIRCTKKEDLTLKEKINKRLILKKRFTVLIFIKRIFELKNNYKRSKNFD